jgi:hypothetical protein
MSGVYVSRELLEKALKADASQGASAIELHEGWLAMKVLRALLAQPADQQGEPLVVKLTGPQEWLDELAKATQPATAKVDAWVPLKQAGQIELGDWLCFTVAGKFICAQAREILNAGTKAEEVIYNRQKNHFFVTSMAVDGTSTHKGVLVAKARAKLNGGEQ